MVTHEELPGGEQGSWCPPRRHQHHSFRAAHEVLTTTEERCFGKGGDVYFEFLWLILNKLEQEQQNLKLERKKTETRRMSTFSRLITFLFYPKSSIRSLQFSAAEHHPNLSSLLPGPQALVRRLITWRKKSVGNLGIHQRIGAFAISWCVSSSHSGNSGAVSASPTLTHNPADMPHIQWQTNPTGKTCWDRDYLSSAASRAVFWVAADTMLLSNVFSRYSEWHV